MKPFQAVIFDMDGVIVDSEPSHERAFLEVMRDLGYGDTHGLRFADYVGRPDEVLWQDFIARHHPPQSNEELLALKTRRVVEIIRRDQPVFAGVVELIEKLAARYVLALASGSERQIVREVLGLKCLGRFFSVSVAGSEVRHGKPAPDIFLRAAEMIRVPPRACCVIEDSKPGIAAGLAAGGRNHVDVGVSVVSRGEGHQISVGRKARVAFHSRKGRQPHGVPSRAGNRPEIAAVGEDDPRRRDIGLAEQPAFRRGLGRDGQEQNRGHKTGD